MELIKNKHVYFSNESEGDGDIATIEKQKIKRPSLYKVLLHNDDYTTMEFVINVLMTLFSKTFDEAQNVMMQIHTTGVGLCGIYTYEVAETKAISVMNEAKSEGFPLKCTIEME